MSERFRFIPPLLAKVLVIGFLVVVLLVPLAQVESLTRERVGMRRMAAQRVAESWGGVQTTAGVLLAIPVETSRVVIEQSAAGRETQRTEVDRNVLYVLPDTLKVDATADLSTRTVGLYATPVYTAHVQISGEFAARDFASRLLRHVHRNVVQHTVRHDYVEMSVRKRQVCNVADSKIHREAFAFGPVLRPLDRS